MNKWLVYGVIGLVFLGQAQNKQEPETINKRLSANTSFFQEVSAQPPLAIQGMRIKLGERVHLRANLGSDVMVLDNPARGRELTSRTAWRHRAIAAINTDFFPYTGDPLGLCIIGGEIVSEPFPNRPAIGWTTEGKVVLGAPQFSGEVTRADGTKFAIAGVNRSAKPEELILSTNYFGAAANAEAKGVAVILETLERPLTPGRTVRGIVRETRDNFSSAPIPFNGGVLMGLNSAGEFLRMVKPGEQLTIRLDLLDENSGGTKPAMEWRKVREAVAGGPWLIKANKSLVKADYEAAGFNEAFWNRRHPRTAVGVTKEGDLLWVVVDGRQTHSQGATLPEMAAILKRYGAVEAINLDGGGSTSMVVQNVNVNSPSDGAERAVANSLLLFDESIRPLTNLQEYAVDPPRVQLKVGDKTRFRVLVNGQAVTNWNIVWGCGNNGFVDQWGRFVALRPGVSNVSAWVGGAWVHAIVEVIGDPPPPPATTPPPAPPPK